MEIEHMTQAIKGGLPKEITEQKDYYKIFLIFLEKLNTQDYSDYIVMTMPNPRVEWYEKSSYDAI